jgi:phage shock protein C
MARRVYRMNGGRMIGGVCAGLADYFDVDITLVRVVFVVLALVNGVGLILYIILWIILPEKRALTGFWDKEKVYGNYSPPEPEKTGETVEGTDAFVPGREESRKGKGNVVAGIILIILGVFLLADPWIPNIRFRDMWPVLLILIGLVLVINAFSKDKRQ